MEQPLAPTPKFVVRSGTSIDLRKRTAVLERGRLGQVVIVAAIAFIATGGLVLLLPLRFLDGLVGIAYVGVALFLLWGLIAAAPTPANRRRWSEWVGTASTLTFDADGIEVESQYESRSIDWLAIAEMRDDGRVLMFLRAWREVAWLDTAGMHPSQRAALVSFAQERIAIAAKTRAAGAAKQVSM